MNKIDSLFNNKKKNIFSVYFTAGYPKLNDMVAIINTLEQAGVDMIEIGMPFSDPMADGPVIQQSNHIALENGMSLKLLFEQLSDVRGKVNIPMLLMGYLNPVLSFGLEHFCQAAGRVGVDGIILPDLPLGEFIEKYQGVFKKHNLCNIFLISPQTSPERIVEIDRYCSGFIYVVSSYSITGAGKSILDSESYFNRIESMKLNNPRMIGFGITNQENFRYACQHSNGAIIGTAFIKALGEENSLEENIKQFVGKIR